jgi:hypothetical protein
LLKKQQIKIIVEDTALPFPYLKIIVEDTALPFPYLKIIVEDTAMPFPYLKIINRPVETGFFPFSTPVTNSSRKNPVSGPTHQ